MPGVQQAERAKMYLSEIEVSNWLLEYSNKKKKKNIAIDFKVLPGNEVIV